MQIFPEHVSSLSISILRQETIYKAIILFFNHNPNLNITGTDLFLFATSQTHFLFNSKFHNEIYGVAMDSPLTAIPSNISIGFSNLIG